MVAVTEPPARSFNVGGVIGAGFQLIARAPLQLLMLAVVLAFLPAIGQVWLVARIMKWAAPIVGAPDYWLGLLREMALLQLAGVVVAGVNWLFQGSVASLAVGQPTAGLVEPPARLLARFPQLFVTGVISNVCVGLATYALIVPGLLLGLAWCAAPAVAGVESHGVFGALKRSADLTRGKRWKLFVLLLLFVLTRLVVIFGVRFASGIPSPLQANTGPAWLLFGVQPGISAMLSLVYAAVMACAYLELRRLTDGVAVGDLAATFD